MKRYGTCRRTTNPNGFDCTCTAQEKIFCAQKNTSAVVNSLSLNKLRINNGRYFG